MAKLINVIKDGKGQLEKRQLPLMIDEKLTMVLDLIDVDFMCEYPKIRGKDKELFLRKFDKLTVEELKDAFQVSCKRLLDIVSEIVPCVGCRRSVERVFHQMKIGSGRSALYPLVVTPEGTLILPEEVYKWPNVIGAMFHNHVSKLNTLSTSWSRSKKSSRCVLHSLDAQRYVRPPLGSGWKLLWECMVPFCKQEVATIDTAQLLSTLETYLQKHRFCSDCRNKVMKAYSLLVDEPEESKENAVSQATATFTATVTSNDHSCKDHCHSHDESSSCRSSIKDKDFIPSLYAGIKRCTPNTHIHVDQRTDYIMGLILAAEPELLGNRRDRHAKTLENAQEEVLVCVGLCLYEKVHRIQLRLREEETTCQLLALVAINALSTNFELAVENKQGISQLELLYEEFNKEEQLKQRKKQVRKLRKRRKKEKKNGCSGNDLGEENEELEEKVDDYEDQRENSEDASDTELIKRLIGKNKSRFFERGNNSCKSTYRSNTDSFVKLGRSEMVSAFSDNKKLSADCCCSSFAPTIAPLKENKRMKSSLQSAEHHQRPRGPEKSKKLITSSAYNTSRQMRNVPSSSKPSSTGSKPTPHSGEGDKGCCAAVVRDFGDCRTLGIGCSNNSSANSIYSKFCVTNTADMRCGNNKKNNVIDAILMRNGDDLVVGRSELCDCCSSPVQIDCGYGSADNVIGSSNGSGDSSVDSSEVACSEGFCNHEGCEECTYDLRHTEGDESWKNSKRTSPSFDYIKNTALLSSASQSLQQMLTETFTYGKSANVDRRPPDFTIPVEEIQRYKSSMGRINEKREQLRETLRNRFAQLCSKQKNPEELPAV